jgi:probable ribonuclease FAU-1
MSERPRRSTSGGTGRRPAPPHRSGDGLAPGAPVSIVHAKPWKRTITMRGTVSSWDGDLLTVERTFSAGGQYDSLNVPKLAGDWGTIEVPLGGWVLRRAYFRRDGTLIGELFNVQTPAEIDERGVHYIDLEVDVVRLPGGHVEVVDEADLDAAVRVGGIRPETAAQARAIAYRLAQILREDGDWRAADTAARST